MPLYPNTTTSPRPKALSQILTTCKTKISQAHQLISRALDLDEEINADSRIIDRARTVEKAKTVLKLYLDGGEILKTVLDKESTKLPR